MGNKLISHRILIISFYCDVFSDVAFCCDSIIKWWDLHLAKHAHKRFTLKTLPTAEIEPKPCIVNSISSLLVYWYYNKSTIIIQRTWPKNNGALRITEWAWVDNKSTISNNCAEEAPVNMNITVISCNKHWVSHPQNVLLILKSILINYLFITTITLAYRRWVYLTRDGYTVLYSLCVICTCS